MVKYFDVIIVGSGPAGTVAALKMARAGFKVALLERGKQPGSKNMFGGLLHNTPVLNELIPSFWEKAPIERHVFKKTLAFLTATSSTSLTFETEDFEKTPYNGATVMRPVFDSWLVSEAVKEGVALICNCTAEDIIREDKRVSGVRVKGREGELRSNIVIAADGVLSFMAEKAGLRKDLKPDNIGLGIKLLLGLPAEIINERFGLVRDEGADFSLLGITDGLRGGGFLFTNKESLSIGLVVHLGSLKASGKTPYDILNTALQHPQLRKLIKGSVPMEYSAHLIPEGGVKGIPGLYTDGMMVVGDAAGLCYTNGINLEGINLAMTSGALSADCAIEALKANDFSSRMLSGYATRLKDSFVYRDMLTFKKATGMMHMERLFQVYPEIVCSIMEKMHRVEGIPRTKMLKILRKEASKKIKTKDLISDGIKIARALL
jgi:electron transfer flavoprotein-quinone oxidoreductase